MHTCVDDRVLGNDTVLCGIGFNDFEFNSSHTSSYEEGIALAHGTVGYDRINELFNKYYFRNIPSRK